MSSHKIGVQNPGFELQQTSQSVECEAAAAPPQPPEQSYPTGLRFVLLTLGLIFTIFLSALDTSIISTAIPRITDQFGTVKDVGWYGSAYTITNAAFQSSWGRAVSRVFGERTTLSDAATHSTNTSRSSESF
jgi:MFS transporter, DHA2 family, glioxin efflux transporter